jgi:alpha,alpha-trehalose-phosphate synthase [UDP-forming]
VSRDAEGQWNASPAVGGLVTALTPILQARGGVWVGWPGTHECEQLEAVLKSASRNAGYSLINVELSRADVEGYYTGFSNEILWPLFHDFIWLCNFDPEYWPVYQAVNRRFAAQTAKILDRDDFIWIHDYHLIPAGAELRRGGVTNRIGFFLHIPVPGPDVFLKLPWREQIVESLLAYDLAGFQTERDFRNFLAIVAVLRPDVEVHWRDRYADLAIGSRITRAGAFPIGIDYDGFTRRARGDAVKEWMHTIRGQLHTRQLMIGVDRLDYTKGIPRRLEAFRETLTSHPDLQQRLTYLQVIVPSRTDVSQYAVLKQDIERLVGEINGQFTEPGWVPIHYIYRPLASEELLAYYRCADIALVVPLKDGMNLVAKEYCACTLDNDGVLILSEFAGSADELVVGALIVNPYDRKAVSRAIYDAFTMETEERHRRMQAMRRHVRMKDVYNWVNTFIESAL